MLITKIKKLYNKNNYAESIRKANIVTQTADKELLTTTISKATNIFITSICIAMVILAIWFSFFNHAKANIDNDSIIKKIPNDFTIKGIQILEGFSPECRPDNVNYSSGGYGSRKLCDTQAKILLSKIKGISKEEALNDLNDRLSKEFQPQILYSYNAVLKQHKKTKYNMSLEPLELSALTFFTYHRGIGYAKNTGIFKLIYDFKMKNYKKQNTRRVGEQILNIFVRASCRYDFKHKKQVFDKGLFARSYVTAMVFFNSVSNISQLVSTKDYAANAVDTKKDKYVNFLVKDVTQYCNSLNN